MGQAVSIHMDVYQRHQQVFAVLVFPILDASVLWVKHPVRGWEPPGGKIEQGETPEQAAHREVWEESGATVTELQWVAEYAVPRDCGPCQYKWVYVAQVVDVCARPSHSETVDVGVMKLDWKSHEVASQPDVSFILKDDMYATLWPIIQAHAQKNNGAVR